MLVLLGKSFGTSKYTILAFKFVKKSESDIYDHKTYYIDCAINSELIFFFFCKSCTCIYPIIVYCSNSFVHYFYYCVSGF